jgi:hypothetical protein
MAIKWNPLAWWDRPDVEYTYVGPALRSVTSTSDYPITEWTISTTTYEPPEPRVHYHPSRSGPIWKTTPQRVTRRQLSRYNKA